MTDSGLSDLLVELCDQFQPARKKPFSKRGSERPFRGFRIRAEELQILAVVEDVEAFLVLPRAEEVGTETRAAPEHLPELRLGAHQLEENNIHDFRDIDTGIEHIDRDSDMGRMVLY